MQQPQQQTQKKQKERPTRHDSAPAFSNPQKKRRGINRVWHAFLYSMQGLRFGLSQPAFRTEALLASILLPAAIWIGRNWQGIALLWAVTALVLIAEILNTALEAVTDRVSPEWSQMAKNAKDAGSAAVFLAMLLCGATWAMALWAYFAG